MGTTIGKAAAARMLMQKDRIMIISHVNPDGDTLGSSLRCTTPCPRSASASA